MIAHPRRSAALVALVALVALAALLCAAGCRSRESGGGEAARGVVVVNAPAAGEVRRVLVSEGARVAEGAPVVEIAVREESAGAQAQPTEDPQARAARGLTAAQNEIETARAEVVRAQVEVDRLTPLVSAGQASEAELDGARARYYQAQQRLQRAQDVAKGAQSGLIAARGQGATAATAATPAEKIVAARATSAGVVSVVSARVGQRVAAGQPLATLRADR